MVVVANIAGAGTEPSAKMEASLFNFDKGAADGRLVWSQTIQENTPEEPKFIHWAQSVIGDVDNDGSSELIVFIQNGFAVLDITTGDIQEYAPNAINRGRNYGTYIIEDVDEDGQNELLVLADLLSLHLEVLQYKESGIDIQWQRSYGAVWPNGSHCLHICGATALNNLNGDSEAELLISDWTLEQGWRLSIGRASDGRLLHEEENLYVLWTGDLTGDGVAEIVAARETALLLRRFTDIVVASFLDNEWRILYEAPNLWLQARAGWPSGEPLLYKDNIRGRS